jgi:cob(I)alamin adenosyltransferase
MLTKNKMKVYTKTGDKGKTSLLGGQKVAKDNVRLEAYGTIDELNSFMGMLLNYKIDDYEQNLISFIQNRLFDIGSELSAVKEDAKYPLPDLRKIKQSDIAYLEQSIDMFSANLPELKQFILPAGSEYISWCNICRTVCRRAERRIISIENAHEIFSNLIIFINRLSDLLFVMGRKYAKNNNITEILWNNNL